MTEVARPEKKNISRSFLTFLSHNFLWFVVLFSLLILLFGFLFLIKPKYEKISNFNLDKKQKQDQFILLTKESNKYIDEVDSLINVYNSIDQSDIEKINLILPKCGDHEELFGQMNNIVKKNGLLLNSISIVPDTSNTSDQKKIIKISFSLGGVNYIGLKNFLKTIESNMRIMDITSLGFNPAENSLNVEIQTYCLE